MTEFTTGQSARVAHASIKSSLKTRDAAQQCAVLWFEEILERKLYKALGYSSINQYAKVALGFSKSHTGEFLQLCRTFKKLPKVKQKVESGELAYTSARVLARVADEKNQDGWLEFALKSSRRELEQEVKLAKHEAADVGQGSLLPVQPGKRPAAVVPVRVSLEMSPTQFARYEALWEKIRKQGNAPADRVEAMLGFMESFVANESERSARADLSAPVQIHINQCPDCETATVQSNKGELEIGEAELERARCDCRISRPNQRNTASIPPSVRRRVLTSARHKCQGKGCDHTQFLEVHHIIPRSRGGTNDLSNLQVLCSACHALVHRFNSAAPTPKEIFSATTHRHSRPTNHRPQSLDGRER
jgi:5-methylcytosine-specific restriction endonuclease McrA